MINEFDIWLDGSPVIVSGDPEFDIWLDGAPVLALSEVTPPGAYQARPEDEIDAVLLEVADDYPWRRSLVGGGEDVDAAIYFTTAEDQGTDGVSERVSVPDQTGAEYTVAAIESPSGRLRLTFFARPSDDRYTPAQPSTGYHGSLRDLADYTATDLALVNSLTDHETAFAAGFAIYHVGLVDGVLVADPQSFNRPAHRDGLVGWFPFNEHVDDDFKVLDASATASVPELAGISFRDRHWDDTLGWHLDIKSGATLTVDAWRSAADNFSLAVWLNINTLPDATTTILELGPVSVDVNSSGTILSYVNDVEGDRHLVTSYAAGSHFRFLEIRKDGTAAWSGRGDIDSAIIETSYTGTTAPFAETDTVLTVQGAHGIDFGICDLRLWNSKKSLAEMDAIRDYSPTPTESLYRIGVYESLNRNDRYAMRVLPNGRAVPDKLPPWIRTPRLERIRRYDSLARYQGESRFKEVGLGGGRTLPPQMVLGQQFYNLTADGTTVVSPPTGAMPGVNQVWLTQTVAGTYTNVVNGTGTAVHSGTISPWPNLMVETNPCREAVWVQGDDNEVYEVTLNGNTTSTTLVAEKIVRPYSALEVALIGTAYGSLAIEQPTGAQVMLATSGTLFTVGNGGTAVYQKPYAGTIVTPPLYLYLNSRVIEEVADAHDRWTEAGNTAFLGENQVPPVAARANNGLLEFTNTSTLAPGYYELAIESGNLGTTDPDFDGFTVETTVDATVLQTRLLRGLSGHNVRGTDTFQFHVENAVSGEWLLSLRWTNAFVDPVKGTARRLAIFSYSLRRLSAELFKVSIANTGTDPVIAPLAVVTYDGTVPGGWLAQMSSYGTASGWQHESQVYPVNDTVASKEPLSNLLTATTPLRREDILFGPDFVLPEEDSLVLPNIQLPIVEDMPLNNAVYEPGRDKIYAVRGGYVFKLNASSGEKEASSRYICPDDGDNYITFDSISGKLYATSWMTLSGGDFPGSTQKYLVQIDPDTLVATPYGPTLFFDALPVSGGHFSEGPREVLAINGKIYGAYYNDNASGQQIWEFDPAGPAITASASNDAPQSSLASFAYDSDNGNLWVPGNVEVYSYQVPGLGLGSNLAINADNTSVKGLCYRAGHLYATLYNSGGKFAYQIMKIRLSDNTETIIDLTRPQANPVHIRYNLVNDRIYVPTWADNSVVIINPNTDTVEAVVEGFDSPFDVVFTLSKAFAVQHGAVGLKEISP